MGLSKEQTSIKKAMTGAVIVSAIVLGGSYFLFNINFPKITTPFQRFAFTLHWDLYASFMLLFGIFAVAGERLFSKASIDGSNADKKIEVNSRYIQNTLEQLILLFISQMTLCLYLNSYTLRIIPIFVIWFIIARICFWVGYHRMPISRAFGFAATFYPTVVVLFVDAILYLL